MRSLGQPPSTLSSDFSSSKRFPGLTRSLNTSGTTNNTTYTSTRNASRRLPSTSHSRQLSAVTASVVEGRGETKGRIGLVWLDTFTMDVHLKSFADTAAYSTLKNELQILDPVEVIVCDTLKERTTNVVLHEAIKSAAGGAVLSAVHRRYYDATKGFRLYEQLRSPECAVIGTVDDAEAWDLCMAASGALIKYVEHMEAVAFSHGVLRFIFHFNDQLCVIDEDTWENLRVVDLDGKKRERRSLFAILDTTLTSMGSRLLRQSLMQPLADEAQINRRLDAVQEIIEKPHFVEAIRNLVGRIFSVDSVLGVVVKSDVEKTVKTAEQKILQVTRLQQTLHLVEPLQILLNNLQSPIIREKVEQLKDGRIDEIATIISNVLNPVVTQANNNRKNSMAFRNQKCYAIKEGLCASLDVARKTYEELLEDLKHEKELEEYLPGEAARLAYSASRQFHYVWLRPDAAIVPVPSHFINVVRNKSSLTFSSRCLTKYNNRIEQTVCEVLLASDGVLVAALLEMRPLMGALYTLNDVIGLVDLIAALSGYALENDMVRPSFGSSIAVKSGRYPVLDIRGDSCTPNDVYLTPHSRFALITGPNMAGKSTYMRMVGSVALLAQIGSFVPAEACSLPLFRKICTRVGGNDLFAENVSSFALEMREMAGILETVGSHSLVLVDELARSTAVEEGIGITYAIIEELLNLKCFVIFTSHFLDLCSLDASYSAIENFHFAPQIKVMANGEEALHLSHLLYRGPYSGPVYGFEIAELCALPPSLMERARSLAERLRAEWRAARQSDPSKERQRVLLRNAYALRGVLRVGRRENGDGTRRCLEQLWKQLRHSLDAVQSSGD